MTAFLFDVDDTLYDQKQPFEKAYRTFFPEDQEMDVGRLFVLSRKYSDEVYEDSQTGRMSMEEMYIYRIRKALEELGRTITDEAALGFQACYQSFQYKIEMSREMETLLEDFSRQVPLGLITNGPKEHQWEKIGALGADRWIPKEHVFISGTLQIAKPDRRIFDYAADVMGLDPGETYFIVDSKKRKKKYKKQKSAKTSKQNSTAKTASSKTTASKGSRKSKPAKTSKKGNSMSA